MSFKQPKKSCQLGIGMLNGGIECAKGMSTMIKSNKTKLLIHRKCHFLTYYTYYDKNKNDIHYATSGSIRILYSTK